MGVHLHTKRKTWLLYHKEISHNALKSSRLNDKRYLAQIRKPQLFCDRDVSQNSPNNIILNDS